MHERVCKTANVMSDLCAICGKHVGTSLVFDGEGEQLGGVLGFLSAENSKGVDSQSGRDDLKGRKGSENEKEVDKKSIIIQQ